MAQPDGAIKSKATGNAIKVAKPPRNLKVPADWDVKPGDVLSWSQGRPTETFLYVALLRNKLLSHTFPLRFSVTSEGALLKNPDTSGSGYLTIPLSITSQSADALNYFSAVLDGVGREYVSSIELAPTDSFFATHFSQQPLPAPIRKRSDIRYSFDPNDEVLHVILPANPTQSQEFPLSSTTLADIVQYIAAENESKGKLVVKYQFDGQDVCSKAPRGIVTGLPAGWKCEQQGAMMFGSEKIQGEWKCQGPEKTKDKARKAIEKFYKGMNVEIN